MYQTINVYEFTEAFKKMGRQDHFSYEGLKALYDFLEQMAEDSGNEKGCELDVIGLCCEFAEDSIKSTLEYYNLKSLDELRDKTLVVWEDGEDVLYQQY